MKVHPREERVRVARTALAEAISRVVENCKLTWGEQLSVVNGAASDFISSMAKFAIRDERHGNIDTPGGRAPDSKQKKRVPLTREEWDVILDAVGRAPDPDGYDFGPAWERVKEEREKLTAKIKEALGL